MSPGTAGTVLLIEDDPVFARMMAVLMRDLRGSRIQLESRGSLREGIERAARGGVDAVLLDLGLGDSRGLETFERMHRAAPAVAIIVITGVDDDDMALDALRLGAQDYLVKGNINSSAVGRALRHAIERKRLEAQRDRLIEELREALANVRTLSGLLPICAHCKKIRDDGGYWASVESYVSRHTAAQFSHGLCPDCLPAYFPDDLAETR